MAPDLESGCGAKWRRVRAAQRLDAGELAARAALIEQVTGEKYDPPSLRGLPYESEVCSFELDVGLAQPAGLLWTTLVSETRARVLIFAIAADFQDRGFGTQVWKMMQEDLLSLGITLVQLEVHASNLAALRLYERLGLNRVGYIRDYYASGDGILMEWTSPRQV